MNGEIDIALGPTDNVAVQENPTAPGTVLIVLNGLPTPNFPTVSAGSVTKLVITGGDDANLIDLTGMTSAVFNNLALSIEAHGGNGADTLLGSDSLNDHLDGGHGTDSIVGNGGNDTLLGDDGNDTITAGNGNDSVDAGDGQDSVDGGAGNDTIIAGDGQDVIDGSAGNDSIDGGDGADTLLGGDDGDTINGGAGDDSLDGQNGDDTIFGGANNDTLLGGSGADSLDGQGGNDLEFAEATTGQVIVNGVPVGAPSNDTLLGSAGNDTLNGADGDDLISGQAGDDLVIGNNGNDSILGGTGNDVLFGDSNDPTQFGTGNDTILGNGGNDSLGGGGGADSIDGGAGNDQVQSLSLTAGILINDVTISEGDVGTVNAIFTVGLTVPSTQTVTVAYTTAGGTATSGVDFIPTTAAAPGIVTFLPGVTSQTISIPIIGDTIQEQSETFFVNLSNAVNAIIVDNQGQGTITDSDAPASASFSVGANVNVANLPGFQSEVTIAVNPANPQNLVAGSNDPSSGVMDAYFSTDGGATWQFRPLPLSVGGTNFVFATDPAVGFDRNGVAYFAYELEDNSRPQPLGANVMARSTDGGNTWSAVLVTPAGSGDDKEFIGIGPDRVNPNVDRIYMGWQRNGAQLVSSSLDGITWSNPVQVSVGVAQQGINSQIAVGPQGEVYFSWQEFGAVAGVSAIRFSRSLDGGLTWSPPTVAVTTNISPFNDPVSGGLYEIPAQPTRGVGAHISIDVDRSGGPNNGRIYLSIMDQADRDGNPLTGHDNTDIFLLSSSDGGVTWSPPQRVNDDGTTASQFYAWMKVDQTNGLVSLSWYDARNDVANNQQVETFMTTSIDGGATFSPNVRVATATSDQSLANPNADPNQYGDYSGLAVYNNIAHPVWTDSRNRNNPDVFTAAVTIAVSISGGPGGVNVGTSLASFTDVGDTLVGGDGNDTILGADGNDLLNGGTGDDSLAGGQGNDSLLGGSGNDTLDGGGGDDTLAGQGGKDLLIGGDGNDSFQWSVGDGDDFVSSVGGFDQMQVFGTSASDIVSVSKVGPRLKVTSGTNDLLINSDIHVVTIDTGAGDDIVTVGDLTGVSQTVLTISGGDGNDRLDASAALLGDVRLQLNGSDGNDTITGSANDDTIDGGAGKDSLFGGAGNDQIRGGADNDAINGQAGDDSITGDDGNDTLAGGDGNDVITGGLGNDALNGNAGADTLTGDDGRDTLQGGTENDSLDGGNGRDYLSGGDGNDTLDGGRNDDTLLGDAGADTIRGNQGNDSIDGGTGDDTISGGDGNDTLTGGDGNDLVTGADGDDAINGAAGNDTLTGGDGNDLIAGGAGNDLILGGDGQDTLKGNGGINTLAGGQGVDSILGLPTDSLIENFAISDDLLKKLDLM